MLNKKAFTLVELIAVIAILGLILAIAVPKITGLLDVSKRGAFEKDVDAMLRSITEEVIKDRTLDITTISTANLKNYVKTDVDNYSSVKFYYTSDRKIATIIVGKEKFASLNAYGTVGNVFVDNSIVADGLVLYLDAGNTISYPGTGNTWFDLSGNNRNGTLMNGVGYNSGYGGTMVLDGSNDYVNMGVVPALTPSNITLSAWVRADVLSSWNGIISNMTGWGTGFSLQIGTSQKVAAMINGSYLMTSWTPVVNTWYHVAATHNASTNLNVLYVNGVSANTSTKEVTYENNAKTYIGVFYTSPNLFFDGYIPTIQIYDRVLSLSEIQQNYNAQKARYGL